MKPILQILALNIGAMLVLAVLVAIEVTYLHSFELRWGSPELLNVDSEIYQ